MAKIYVPSAYLNNCNIINGDYIRSFTNSNQTQWVDIYFNNHYALKEGSSSYGYSYTCDRINTYTDNIYYRNDIDQILVIFIILLIICFWFPYRIISRMFGRWLKC